MNMRILKILFLSTIFLGLLSCHLSHAEFNNTKSIKQELDFKILVKKFCGSNKKNFCSSQSLKMMFEIEEKRQKELELARQLKRMEQQIIKNILNMNDKLSQKLRALIKITNSN